MHPKISIVTPSYNQGQYIEETICSILDQHYPNLEYIIMDGGSKDNTVEVIKKYEKHITYWTSERDKGQSDAINKGFKIATGDVINWLNSDDYFEKDTLRKVGEAFSNPATNVYMGISRVFGNKGDYFSNGTDIYPGNLEKTIGWARIDQPETFFRKSCLDSIGYVDEQFHYTMDKELWIRYLLKYGFEGMVKTKDLLAHFRIHDDSKTNNFQEKFNQETMSLFYTMADINGSSFLNTPAAFKPGKLLDLKYKGNYKIDVAFADKIINYCIYYLFLEKYAFNDYSGAKEKATMVNVALLSDADKNHFKEIMLRMKLLPPFVKKLLNKLK